MGGGLVPVTEPGPLDPLAPLFFLSYGHRRRRGSDSGPTLEEQFFDDLMENVSTLVHRQTGAADPGFMDRSMPGGERWTPELLEAIGTCQIFVALLSEPFLNSKWCGMEWHAFSLRKVRPRRKAVSGNQTCLVPVVWATFPRDAVCGAVRAVQRFRPTDLPEPSFATRYEHDGLFGLLRSNQREPYNMVVWRLAQHIAELHRSHWVEPRTFKQRELRNVFQERES